MTADKPGRQRQPKSDCFAYRDTVTDGQYCEALDRLHCLRGPCSFHKTPEQLKGEQAVTRRCNEAKRFGGR